MKNYTFKSIAILLLTIAPLSAQVGVGTTSPKSTLEIKSTNPSSPAYNDGLLIPRIDAFPAVNPGSDQEGMLVFLTTPTGSYKKGFHYWDDTPKQWKSYGGEWIDDNVVQYRGDFDNDLVYARQAGANGADVVILDSGQMGIGTNTPEESIELKFEGDNDIQITSVSPPNAPNLIFFTTGGTDFNNRNFLSDNDEIGYITGKAWTGSGKSSDISNMMMLADGNHSAGSNPTKIQFSTTAVGDSNDKTNGVEMTIKNDGKVGIGTETPTALMDVAGSARVRDLVAGPVYSDANGNLSNTAVGPVTVAAGKVNSAGTALKVTGATTSRTATGKYSVTFTTPRSSSNYIIQLSVLNCNSCGTSDDSYNIYYENQTTTGFTVIIGYNDNGGTAKAAADREFMFSVIDF